MTTKSRQKNTRLQGFDYAQEGAYFVTICTHNRICLLGEVIEKEMRLNASERVIQSVWLQTAKLRSYFSLDSYVIMPNHFHAVFFLQNHEWATRWVALPRKHRQVALHPAQWGLSLDSLNRRQPSGSSHPGESQLNIFGNAIIMNTWSETKMI